MTTITIESGPRNASTDPRTGYNGFAGTSSAITNTSTMPTAVGVLVPPRRPFAWKGLASMATRLSTEERFWSRVDASGDCWEWTGGQQSGYGYFSAGGKKVRVHRFAWVVLVGPLDDDETLDHLCRNRSCVSPAHLEPVSAAVNVKRGWGFVGVNVRLSACRQGHPFDEANTYLKDGRRHCRRCRVESNRRIRLARKAAA